MTNHGLFMHAANAAVEETSQSCSAALLALGYHKIDEKSIADILLSEGSRFSSTLSQLRTTDQFKDGNRQYIAAVLSAVTPTARRVIKEIVGAVNISTDDLIEISKAEGRAFRAAITAVSNNPSVHSDELAYLRRTLSSVTEIRIPSIAKQEKKTPNSQTEDLSATISGKHKLNNQNPVALQYKSIHIYGASFGLCISEDITRKGSLPTLRFEFAKAINEGVYDWERKIAFQCSPGELALLCGVFFGYVDQVELSSHGKNNEKSLSLSNQEYKYYINLRVGKSAGYGVPITPSDAFLPTALVFHKIKQNSPELDESTLLSIVERVCHKYKTK